MRCVEEDVRYLSEDWKERVRVVKAGRETSSGEASAEVDRVGSKGSIISTLGRYLRIEHNNFHHSHHDCSFHAHFPSATDRQLESHTQSAKHITTMADRFPSLEEFDEGTLSPLGLPLFEHH